MSILKLTVISLILIVTWFTAGEVNAVSENAFSADKELSFTSNISSTAVGGPWSAPSTWVGGTVPTASDDVTITPGATVIIDTTASANSVTVGGPGSLGGGVKTAFMEGTLPAVLKFGDSGPFWLTVTSDVTIGPNDSFTTGGGNGNQHQLTVGGNLTNNGTLDFSTNNNQAAAMLVFTGASNNTFGGTGPVTDISWLTIEKGTNSTFILELSVANFSVRGMVTDTPDSGFLFLNHGTFKISGTITLSNRTFFNTPYEIAAGTGFWLNNPNYTIVARHQDVVPVYGLLRVTAGTYNIGTQLNDSLVFWPGSTVIVDGGDINIAGGFKMQTDGSIRTTYEHSAGVMTTCVVGFDTNNSGCFYLGSFPVNVSILLTGGEIVLQNPASGSSYFVNGTSSVYHGNTTLRVGNAATNGPGNFRVGGEVPNLVIDTSAGGHTVTFPSRAHNVEIGPGGTLSIANELWVFGETFINNGILKSESPSSSLLRFLGQDPVYSGTGVIETSLRSILAECDTLTIDGVDLSIRSLSIYTAIIYPGPNKVTVLESVNSSTGYVDGTLVRKITIPQTYVFPVGRNGYSAVTANVSAVGTDPSYLSATAVDTTLPGLPTAYSASRYWHLEETGDITASLTFGYTDADVSGSEANYSVWWSTGAAPSMIAGSVPLPNSNTVSTPGGIVDFTGDWGVGAQPDSGPVTISGSVTTSGGQPIRNAALTISGGNVPSPVTVQTGNFGTYAFSNLQAGETYSIRVDVKRYRFAQTTQVVTPLSNVGNVNFVANPQE